MGTALLRGSDEVTATRIHKQLFSAAVPVTCGAIAHFAERVFSLPFDIAVSGKPDRRCKVLIGALLAFLS